jgi:hypothetical protein
VFLSSRRDEDVSDLRAANQTTGGVELTGGDFRQPDVTSMTALITPDSGFVNISNSPMTSSKDVR